MTQTKEEKLKVKFVELDTDGDGTLSFEELKDILQKGNPAFKSNEVMKLYKKCDLNGDGKIQFDEFLQYIYGKDKKDGKLEDSSEVDWDSCKLPFEAFCAHGHKDMEGKEFAKFCKDTHLIGKGMEKTDVDLIFVKVVPKGKRRMDFVQFQQACRHIALKRKVQNVEIQNIVMASHGPELHGTKTDAVRFFDDKSTFTGAASHNKAFDGADPDAQLGRHEKQQAAADAELHGGQENDDWSGVEATFNKFAGPEKQLDGKELIKFADDVHLLGSGLTKQDVDVTFSSVARKAKKINFEQFKDIVRNFAKKKHKTVAELQLKIAESEGPVLHATKADYVRFADDKSTFTGAHAAVHGREDGHGGDRHAESVAKHAAAAHADEGERPWDEVKAVFAKFSGEDGLDNREFAKFCKDAGLICGKFVLPDVDIIFTSVVPRGTRKIDAEMFCQAVREIASKKSVPTHQVQGTISQCEGPILKGTVGASKFHDDKSLYTGTHTDK